jgi:peptidoglycan-associated lipoprotein
MFFDLSKETKMTMRLFVMLFAVLFITACETAQDPAEGEMTGDRENITGDPLDDQAGVDEAMLDGPTPGTQPHLIATVGDRVFFGFDQHNLTDEARDVVAMQAEWMQQYPYVDVTIEGHADERGTREYNLALGERRATSVKNYLIASGIEPSRINVISYGKERPAVPGSNPSAWAQNRRAVMIVE